MFNGTQPTVMTRNYLFVPALSTTGSLSPLFDVSNYKLDNYPLSYDSFSVQGYKSPGYNKNKLYEKKHARVEKEGKLYERLSGSWTPSTSPTSLPLNQCYTVYVDVRSVKGDVVVGLATKRIGTSSSPYDFNDTFVGFRRYSSLSGGYTGAAVEGVFIGGSNNDFLINDEVKIGECNGVGCPSDISQNFRINIEVCNTTTVEFVPSFPLGISLDQAFQQPNFEGSYTFNVDLRGDLNNPVELDVFALGISNADVFVMNAKEIPTPFTNPATTDSRNLYSVVMDASQLQTNNWSPVWGSAVSNTYTADNCSGGTTFSATPFNQSYAFTNLFCAKLPTAIFLADTDYLIDIGLFSQSSPLSSSSFHSVAIGLKSGGNFVGFNRVGYAYDRLGDVITASADSYGLYNVFKNASNQFTSPYATGTVKFSNTSANLFNLKIAVYGKHFAGESPSVTVFAGTPDCPPNIFLYEALGEINFDFQAEVDVCLYQQSNVTDETLSQQEIDQILNQNTVVNGLTLSIEQAQFGCHFCLFFLLFSSQNFFAKKMKGDGIDLSGKYFDSCGVCGGSNACVGCDGKPYSGASIDACGVCQGNNETCCTNRFGIDNELWDWLLAPYIIDDIIKRFHYTTEELEDTCIILNRYTDICNKDPVIASAFQSVDFAGYITENQAWNNTCLSSFNQVLSKMNSQISQFVALENFSKK